MSYHIVVIAPDHQLKQLVQTQLAAECQVSAYQDLTAAMAELEERAVELVLLESTVPGPNGDGTPPFAALHAFKAQHPTLDVALVGTVRDPQTALAAIRAGAIDYLARPLGRDELLAILERGAPWRALRERHAAWLSAVNLAHRPQAPVGQAPAYLALLDRARRVQGHPANILIEGESGTGKEVLARFIHQLEDDPARPLVVVNCAAIPEQLLESELFGHERGAFTGAEQRRLGKCELAHGGDLFLDEIASLKWDLQAKLLRVLQEHEITRVGGTEVIPVRFRVLAASNEDLEELVRRGRFRSDLFHRLRVIPFRVPALRERAEDIPVLARTFLRAVDGNRPWHFSVEALAHLQAYPWPGNIRELAHLVQSLVVLTKGPEIPVTALPRWLLDGVTAPVECDAQQAEPWPLPASLTEVNDLRQFLRYAEQRYVHSVLQLTKGDKTRAASLLKVSRTGLYGRMRRWEPN